MVKLWNKNNQVSPNKINVIRKRIGVGRWETYAIHFLT
jgi:hypothetical protein